MKTNELAGAALDWAVAKCEGYTVDWDGWLSLNGVATFMPNEYKPSTNWAQGGAIIEREGICVGTGLDSPTWYANKGLMAHHHFGQTPLIAAMRCYVASKLGDEVEVPVELN
jgi:hypothetical protein